MIITCECGYEDEREVKFNLTYPKKDTEIVWQCESCGKIHIIEVKLRRVEE